MEQNIMVRYKVYLPALEGPDELLGSVEAPSSFEARRRIAVGRIAMRASDVYAKLAADVK